MARVHDPTQQEEGEDAQWANEPHSERDPTLKAHTERPFNAEPPNSALREMITPKGLHYRRQHTPVPMVNQESYHVSIGFEGQEPRQFSMAELRRHNQHDVIVTLMCTGNRRSEFNTDKDGETLGLPWKNGSISTAKWSGASIVDVLHAAGLDFENADKNGYRFLTFWGLEDYHISIPLKKAFATDGDVILAWAMNGVSPLPRDHGFPLRVIVPGFVGARSVKWLHRIVLTKKEVDGMHQTGIAYKQLAPNQKVLGEVPKHVIEALPPIDHVPITSAITSPEPGATVARGDVLLVTGYAYSGAGHSVIRVDVSIDDGETWAQADLTRAGETQGVRSGRAWAWVQWRLATAVSADCPSKLTVLCKAVDDQYNQQPHEAAPIWNIRGILNTSWGRAEVQVIDRARL